MGVTCGLVVPSLRSDVTLPCRSFSPAVIARAGLTSASTALARTVTPSRGGPALVQRWVVGSVAAQVGMLIPSTTFTMSCRAVSMSDEKICVSSGSYVSGPSGGRVHGGRERRHERRDGGVEAEVLPHERRILVALEEPVAVRAGSQ